MTTKEIQSRVAAIKAMDAPTAIVARQMLDDDFIRSLAAMAIDNPMGWRVIRNQAQMITGWITCSATD